MGDHLVDMHHVGIFVMQVEQIDLVRQRLRSKQHSSASTT